MPGPSFTAAEQLLIGRILEPADSSLSFEVAYLVPAAALIGVGFAYSAPAAFAAAFAIIAAFRVWQVSGNRRSLRVLRAVIRKYDHACAVEAQPIDAP